MISIFNPFSSPKINTQNIDNYIEQSMCWLKKYKLSKNDTYARGIANVGAGYIINCYPSIKSGQIQDLIDFASWNCILDDLVENGKLSKDHNKSNIFLSLIEYP